MASNDGKPLVETSGGKSTRGGDTRGQLVQAALDIITKGGVDSLRIEDVAAAVGVTKGSIYWHFDDRDALVRGALAEYIRVLFEEFYAGLHEAITSFSNRDEYLVAIAPYVVDPFDRELMERRWERVELVCAIRRDPELWQEMQRLHAETLQKFSDLMTEARQRGALSKDVDPHALAMLLQVTGIGAIWVDLAGDNAPTPENWQNTLLFVINALFPAVEPDPGS